MPLRRPFSHFLHGLAILTAMLAPLRQVRAAPEPAGALYGSGFFIGSNGLLLTAAHVVQRCRRVVTETSVGAILDAQTLRVDAAMDVALLQVRAARPVAMLTLRRDPPSLGEAVSTMGFPFLDALESRPTFEIGIVTGLGGLGGDPTNFRVSIPLAGGYSGAALVDRAGMVIGLARGFAAHARAGEPLQPANINLAVTGPRLADLLRTVPAGAGTRALPVSNLVLAPPQAADLLSRTTVLVRCVN